MKELIEKIKQKIKLILIIISILSLLSIVISFLYYKVSYLHNILNELKIIFNSFHNFINYPIITIWKTNLTILSISIFITFIIIGFALATLYKKFIYSIRKKYKNSLSYNTASILANIWYYAIITLILLSSLKLVWIDLSNLTLIAWALSVWIWFWLQNVISNFISWIILIFEKSIKVWDYVELSDGNRGKVIDIRIRSTTIRTNNNIDIIIPNQKIIENNIINWTLNDNKVRFKIPFWVAYWTKIKDVENAILWALKESKLNYMKTGDYSPLIVMTWMWDSSVNFELFIWVKWDASLTPNRTKSDFLKLIYNALNNNNISIPFPQTDLHIKDSIPLELKIAK